jgi:hypothetical protein
MYINENKLYFTIRTSLLDLLFEYLPVNKLSNSLINLMFCDKHFFKLIIDGMKRHNYYSLSIIEKKNEYRRSLFKDVRKLICDTKNINLNTLRLNSVFDEFKCVTHLKLYHFNEPYMFSQKLVHLTLGNFNQQIMPCMLPSNLTYLELGNYDQQLVSNVLPPNLKHLKLGRFNQQLLTNVLPNKLEHLTFGLKFNQPLLPNVLPSSLLYLTFGDETVKSDYPNYINNIYCVVGVQGVTGATGAIGHGIYGNIYCDIGDFNQKIEKDVLPQSLIYLRLSNDFNQILDEGNMPQNLCDIIVGRNYNKQLTNEFISKYNVIMRKWFECDSTKYIFKSLN